MRSIEIKVLLTKGHLLLDLVASARKFHMLFNKYLHILPGTVKSPWDIDTKRHGPVLMNLSFLWECIPFFKS